MTTLYRMIRESLPIVGVVTFFFALFLAWHLSLPQLTGYDDPYYHAKHAELIAASGTWQLPNTWVVYQAPVDAYVLAHALLSRLIIVFGTIVGTKVFAALQASLIFGIFFWILRRQQIKYPLCWTGLLALASPVFLTRLLYERPFVLSIALFILCYELMRERRYWWLGIVSALYILYYNLAPLVLFLAIANLLTDVWHRESLNLKPLIATLSGLTAGILLYPNRSNYIVHMSVHFFWVPFLKLIGVTLDSGSEIQFQSLQSFAAFNILLVSLLIITGCGLWILHRRYGLQRDLQLLTVLTLPWFVISMAVPRGAEYCTPLLCLLTAQVITALNRAGVIAEIRTALNAHRAYIPSIGMFVICLLFVSTISIPIRANDIRHQLDQSRLHDLADANAYLIAHTPAQSIVYYPLWDMFPLMFYFNTHNRYIMGFDPAFLYTYNHEMFWIRFNLTFHGTYCNTAICKTPLPPDKNALAAALGIQYVFGSNMIIAEDRTVTFTQFLLSHPQYFTEVYHSGHVHVFHIQTPRHPILN